MRASREWDTAADRAERRQRTSALAVSQRACGQWVTAASRSLALLVFASLALAAAASNAQIFVFLNFNNFQTRLNQAASSAGVPDFTVAETNTIRDNIVGEMQRIYSGLTVNFQTTQPAGVHEVVHFGRTTNNPGVLGVATRIDYRNLHLDDIADVFTANFGFTISPGHSRPDQINRLSFALSGTGAHELGHNLGLQHHDTYGNLIIKSGVPSGGLQNDYIMATGSTGLTTAGRVVPRSFNAMELAKLEFANNVVPNPIAPILEQAAPHGSAGTAQSIPLTAFSTGLTEYTHGASIIGSISSGGQLDYYSFDLMPGVFTANVLSSVLFSSAQSIDSILSFYAPDGTTLLAINDDIAYNNSGINIPGAPLRSLDSLILNYDILTAGTYYLQVRAFSGSDTGNYELFVAASMIPEPGHGILLVVALSAMVLAPRRRCRNVDASRPCAPGKRPAGPQVEFNSHAS